MKREKLLQVITIISLGINILLFFNVANLKKSFNELRDSYYIANNSISAVDYKVNDLITSLDEADSFITSTNIEFDETSYLKDGFTVNIDVSLKYLSEGEVPKVLYRQNNGTNISQWADAELVAEENLSFNGKLDLKYNGNYDYRIVTEGTVNRGSKIFNIYTDEYSPVSVMSSGSYSNYSDNGKVEECGVEITVLNKFGIDDFNIEKVVLKIKGLDKEFPALNLENAYNDKENYQGIEYIEKFEYKYGNNSTYDNYKVGISNKDIPQDFRGPLPSIIEVTCKNGAVFTSEEYLQVN